jgi:hypothetical protein
VVEEELLAPPVVEEAPLAPQVVEEEPLAPPVVEEEPLGDVSKPGETSLGLDPGSGHGSVVAEVVCLAGFRDVAIAPPQPPSVVTTTGGRGGRSSRGVS